MFIVRNTTTGETGEPFEQARKFLWLTGDVGFNAQDGVIHGDEKLYEVVVETTGTGPSVADSFPAYDSAADRFVITRTLTNPAPTDDQKAGLKSTVNGFAEGVRQRYITPGSGQAMSYREKLDEARLCLAAYPEKLRFDGYVDGTYPLLESEVGVHGEDVYEVARLVETTYESWVLIEAQINKIRQKAQADIDAAGTLSEARAVLSGLVWPTP